MTDLKNTAIAYAVERGWSVFPAHGIDDAGACTCGQPCTSPGKHPATPQGLKNASKDSRAIALMWREGFNIAVATGEASGFWVLDIDGQAGEQSLATLESEHGPLPATLTHYTGNGRHLLFTWPGTPIKNSVRKLGQGLDIRGDGGYIVAAPSRHVSGAQYRFADPKAPIAPAPAWLLDLVRREPTVAAMPADYPAPDRDLTEADVQSMLAHIHPDSDYQTWLEVGMGLHAGGWPVQLWDTWSRDGAKYQAGDCYRRWKGFKPGAVTMGSVWHHAELGGWSPAVLDTTPTGEHPARAFLSKVRDQNPIKKKDDAAPLSFPFDPLQLTGVIGDTVRWICASAIHPQPELALLNTLAALGAVFGRRYATEWDTRTNVYIVGLAGTGSGKEHSRKRIKKLMVAAGLHDFLMGDDVISDAGILTGVEDQPAQILHLDEIGMTLKAISDDRAPSSYKKVSKVLTVLFSSSGSVYTGGRYAGNVRKPVVIDDPSLCIYGTSTTEEYVGALSRSAIASGELNRFIVIEGRDDVPPSRGVRDLAPDPKLVAEWATYRSQIAEGQGNLQAIGGPNVSAPKPILVRWDGVLDRLLDMGDRAHALVRSYKREGKGGVWSRYREQVIKLAMIAAIARNPVVPAMEHSDLDFAESLVKHSCDFVMNLARDRISDSPQERAVNEILDIVRAAGDEGIAKSKISQRTRGMAAKQRDSILADLANVQGEIEVVQSGEGRGRQPLVYRYCGSHN